MFFSEGNEHEDMPVTERIPVELMKPFLNKGHILYTDNFYTNPMLASFFLQNQTYLCGTVKKNRKHYCKDISNIILEKGTASFYQTSNVNSKMLACKYRASKDKAGNKPKVVLILSTFHNPFMVNTGKVDRDENHNMKPAMVPSHSVHMSGVDSVDQQLHGIQALRKSYKWYKKLIFRLLLQVSMNSHKVYQKCTGSNMVFLDYLTNNIKLMIALTPPIPPAINYAILQSDVERLTGSYFPTLIPWAPGATSRSHKRCQVCYSQKKSTKKGNSLKTSYIYASLLLSEKIYQERKLTEDKLHLCGLSIVMRPPS